MSCINKYLYLLIAYKNKYLNRQLRHYYKKYYIYGGKTEEVKEEVTAVIHLKYVQGLDRYLRRGKFTTLDRYIAATINGGIKDYFAEKAKWELHHKTLSSSQEPFYKPEEFLALSDFSFTGLTEEEVQVVIYRMYDLCYHDISRKLPISPAYARQLHKRGLAKMRKNKKNLELFDYWFQHVA